MEGDNQSVFFAKRIDLGEFGKGSRMLIGDINGDGRLEMVFVQPDKGFDDRYFPHKAVCAAAFSLEGEMLWQIGTPDPDASAVCTDVPAQIYDIDNDGNNEFLCVFGDEFCIFDGLNGNLKRKWQLPDPSAHDAIIIADLEGRGYAQNIILKNRFHQMWAMDANFNLMWTVKGNIGNFPWPYDLDGDSRDEIITGNSVYDGEGNLVWSVPVSGCINTLNICDLDRNPSAPQTIISGGEELCAYSAAGELLWTVPKVSKVRSVISGNFISSSALLQFAVLCCLEEKESLVLIDNRGKIITSVDCTFQNGCSLSVVRNFAKKHGEYILVHPGGIQPASIYDGTLSLLFTAPFNGRVTVADSTGSGISDLFIYNSERVEIYTLLEHSLQSAALPYAMPQSKALYNSSIFQSGEANQSDYQLGYVTGDFSHDALAAWATKCLLGTADGIDTAISRADFTVLLVEALSLQAYERNNFSDVHPTAYYAKAVGIAKKLGITEGTLGRFNPNSPMTAEAAVEMIKRTGKECFLMSDGELTRRSAAKIVLELLREE